MSYDFDIIIVSDDVRWPSIQFGSEKVLRLHSKSSKAPELRTPSFVLFAIAFLQRARGSQKTEKLKPWITVVPIP